MVVDAKEKEIIFLRDSDLSSETPKYFSIKGKSYPGCV